MITLSVIIVVVALALAIAWLVSLQQEDER
jgi:hypothetical protein